MAKDVFMFFLCVLFVFGLACNMPPFLTGKVSGFQWPTHPGGHC